MYNISSIFNLGLALRALAAVPLFGVMLGLGWGYVRFVVGVMLGLWLGVMDEVTPGLTNVQALLASTIMSAARPGNSGTPVNIIPPTESLSPPRDSASTLINGGDDIPTRSDLGTAIAAARGLLSASEAKVLRAVREALDGIENVDRTRSAVLLDRVEYLAAAEERRAATEGVNDAVSTEEALALGRVVQSLERRVEQQHEEHMRQMRAIVDTQENLTRMIETLLVRQGEAPPAVKKRP